MKLRAGIIGLGVGEAHIEGYRSHPHGEVVSLCDFSKEKFESAQKKYPKLFVTRDANKILKDPSIDVVSIASYDNYHFEQIKLALEHDKHVFVEKPLCLHESEARAIRRLLESKPKLKLSSNLILRQSPRFLWLKKEIKKGRLGNLYYLEGDYNYGRIHKITEGWRGKIDFYSVVYGGGVHLVDLLLWLTGDTVEEVTGYGNRIATRGTHFRYSDCTAALLKFKSGVLAKVTSNFSCVFPHFHGLNVYGTNATFVNDLGEARLYKSRDPKKSFVPVRSGYPGIKKGGLIPSFLDAILTGKEALVSSEDVFRVMSVCFAIEKSMKEKNKVKVKYL